MSDTVPPVPYGDFYDPPPTNWQKDPYDEVPIIVDFGCVLSYFPGDTVATVSAITFNPGDGVSPDLMQNGAPSITTSPMTGALLSAVSVPVQMGVVGTVYSVSVYIATAMGLSLKRSTFVPVNAL